MAHSCVPLTAGEQEIYAAIGYAQTQWAELEHTLSRIFRESVSPAQSLVTGQIRMSFPAEDAFWAVVAFDGRMKMTIQAVNRHLGQGSEFFHALLLEEWAKASKRANEKARNRNALAHGSVVVFKENDQSTASYAPYYYKAIAGRHAILGPPDNEVRIMTSKPPELWDHKRVYAIAKGFNVSNLRLKVFLAALQEHNTIVAGKLSELQRVFLEGMQSQFGLHEQN